jgi:hypothetical protein
MNALFLYVDLKVMNALFLQADLKVVNALFLQADLKVVNDAKGGSFYRDHLPLLGN